MGCVLFLRMEVASIADLSLLAARQTLNEIPSLHSQLLIICSFFLSAPGLSHCFVYLHAQSIPGEVVTSAAYSILLTSSISLDLNPEQKRSHA